jgi:hypothetical protein
VDDELRRAAVIAARAWAFLIAAVVLPARAQAADDPICAARPANRLRIKISGE